MESGTETTSSMTQDIACWLRFYKQLGIEHLHISQHWTKHLVTIDAQKTNTDLTSLPTKHTRIEGQTTKTQIIISDSTTIADTKQQYSDIASLNEAISACQSCLSLTGISRPLIGRGNTKAKIVILMQAPDNEDVLQKKIFSGNKATLLDLMLNSIKINPSDVYLTCLFKCPQQTQKQGTTSQCLNFFINELTLIQPDFILEFGKSSAFFLLEKTLPLKSLRCKLHISPILLKAALKTSILFTHPFETLLDATHLARQQDAKKETWQDLRLLQDLLNKKQQTKE